MKWLKLLLWPTRKLEEATRPAIKSLKLPLRRRRNLRAYKGLDVAWVLSACSSQPLYSLVVPVFRTDLKLLRRCIASVRNQLYERWELILVDDGSQLPKLNAELEKWAARDERIRIFKSPRSQGIVGATNLGIAQARGRFVGFLDHDAELTPDALLWMAVAHNANPHSRWFYSDEATLEPDGNYAGRFHRKPDYSWEYLLSVMYTCHFSAYDRGLLETVGGLRLQFDGAQDHDLALRISECVDSSEVTHIPHALYFCRATSQSTSNNVAARSKAPRAAHRAVSEAVQRRRLRCDITPDPEIGTSFQLRLQPRTSPKVTILIPTRNAAHMLKRCVESLSASTNYRNYDILVIDNQSDEADLARYLDQLKRGGRCGVMRYDQPFNHSDMHNRAIADIESELVLFLNNDVYSFSEGWLEQLVATIELDPRIAGVGAKLFYPDGTIQHAGMVIGSCNGLAGHIDYQQPGNTAGYFGRSRALQQVSGVTAALMLMRKSAFQAVGGFNTDRYPTSFNDVDLWARLTEAGFRCLFNPMVQAIHEECKTRKLEPKEREFQTRLHDDLIRRQWSDRYWNLTLFSDPGRLLEYEKTWDWIRDKLTLLCMEAQLLGGPRMASPLHRTKLELSKKLLAGVYALRIHRTKEPTRRAKQIPEPNGCFTRADMCRELSSADEVFGQA